MPGNFMAFLELGMEISYGHHSLSESALINQVTGFETNGAGQVDCGT